MGTVLARTIGIDEYLARRLRPIAIVIGLLIGLAPPATYYVFERLALTAAAPIRFYDRDLGSVRVEVSHARLSVATLGLAALSMLAGAGLAGLVYWFPVKVVGRAERRIGELVSSLDRQVKETDALLEIARATDSSRDAEEFFGIIAQGALQTCAAELCGVLALDDGGLRLRRVTVVTSGPGGGPLPALEIPAEARVADVPFATEAIRRRAPVILDDAGGDPRLPPRWRVLRGRLAMLAVPLSDRNRIVGILLLGYGTDRPLTADGVRVATALADQVALALHNIFLIHHLSGMVQQLRAKNAELDSFAYSVSHDLRAPLVSLQGLAGMLATEYGSRLDETGRHYLERIMYNGAHMERLLCDVLSLSRVGREAQEPEPVDLRALVDEILAQHADAIRDRGIEIVVHDLGSLVAVRTQVTQVLSNLIDNAIKYLGDAPRRVIEIGSALHDDFVEGWVRDTGPGIDPLYHEKIFEPFERLQEIEAPGTGLGLAIARKLVEGAGGRIWVESARHQGATFRFTWPAPSSELGPRAA